MPLYQHIALWFMGIVLAVMLVDTLKMVFIQPPYNTPSKELPYVYQT